MSTRPRRRTPEAIAAELDVRERVLLFCLGSDTNAAEAGVNNASARSRLIVRGLIDRNGSQFVITEQGREVLAALLAKHDKGR
jgi:hypothetical protein